MEGGDGYSLLEWVQRHSPRTLVTVITGFASMESTIRAMRMGAFDYLVKPLDVDRVSGVVGRALEAARLMRVPAALPTEPAEDRAPTAPPHELSRLEAKIQRSRGPALDRPAYTSSGGG